MRKFMHFSVCGAVLLCCALLGMTVGSANERGAAGNTHQPMASARKVPHGLYVDHRGILMHNGHPFRGIGVNYFDAFSRNNASYLSGFSYLHSHGIPYIRFMAAPGFWPDDTKQYLADPHAYFQRMDAFVHNAEINGIGLIPSLFWNSVAVSDAMGEARDQWGNPSSKTIAFVRSFTRKFVTRYRNSPAIWAWEFSNEMNSVDMDLLNKAADHRPVVSTAQGTPAYRSARDDLTTDQLQVAITQFASTVRLYDKDRLILSGNNIAGSNQYNRYVFRKWTPQDTREQFGSLLAMQNPDPVNSLTMHIYPEDAINRYFAGSTTYADVLNVAMREAAAAHKPLDIEEFGALGNVGGNDERTNFEQLLNAIVKARVPLASLWVYDFSFQNNTWNITQTNARAYQLIDVINADKAIRAQSGPESTLARPQHTAVQ